MSILLKTMVGTEHEPFESGYQFYFDETNNFRKFSLRPDKTEMVNDAKALRSDFILGGICFRHAPDINSLFVDMKLQKSIRELKSRYLYETDDFVKDISGHRISVLVDWLYYNRDLYLHYACENNLYFALTDIVDSLCNGQLEHMMAYHHQLKGALYRICRRYEPEVLDILCRYHYPDVPNGFTRMFARELSAIVENADVREDFFAETVRQMLRSVPEDGKMLFIQDNEPFILSENYGALYFQRGITFWNSAVTFDTEAVVVSYLENTGMLSEMGNCTFKDSTEDRYIQVSDCVVSLLSKLFTFLDSLDDDEIGGIHLTDRQLQTITRLKRLIDRSDEKSELLILNINAQSLVRDRYIKLEMLCR